MYLTWLGAAGFKLDTAEGAVILIDPFLSRPAEATPPLPLQMADLLTVDEILLTNGQFDHALDTPALVRQTGAIVHAPGAVCQRLAENGVPAHNLECVTLNKIKGVGNLTWQALAGQINQADSSPTLRALMGNRAVLALASILARQWPTGETVTYFFQAEGLSLMHFGSAGWLDAAIEGFQPDIALLPVETAAAETVLRLVALLRPKVVIPHHWDNYYPPLSEMIDLSVFEAHLQAEAPAVRVYQPVIGERVKLAELV